MVKAGALKKRYILFKYQGPAMDMPRLKRAIYHEALRFFGEYGLSEAALKLVGFDAKSDTGVIRCQRDYIERALGFLALVDSLDGSEARLVALRSSGTLKSLESVLESTH